MQEKRRENTNVEVEKKKSLDGFLVSDSVVGFNGSWTTPIGRESTWNIDLDWEHLEFWYPGRGIVYTDSERADDKTSFCFILSFPL